MIPPGAVELLQRASAAKKRGDLAVALREAEAAVAVSRADNDPDTLISALRLMGQCERDRANPARALAPYEEAVRLCAEHGSALHHAHAIRHLGDLLVELDRPAAAVARYERALAIYRENAATTPPLDLANELRAFAVSLEALGDAGRARALWEEARGLYASVNVIPGVEECDAHLAR